MAFEPKTGRGLYQGPAPDSPEGRRAAAQQSLQTLDTIGPMFGHGAKEQIDARRAALSEQIATETRAIEAKAKPAPGEGAEQPETPEQRRARQDAELSEIRKAQAQTERELAAFTAGVSSAKR